MESLFLSMKRKDIFSKEKRKILKTGMIVEYFNNNKWYTKQITQIDSDWDKSLKLTSQIRKS
jgi:hypothetical protein